MDGDVITAFNCHSCGGLYPWPVYIPLRMGAKTYDDFMSQYGLVCTSCMKKRCVRCSGVPAGTTVSVPVCKCA